MQDLSHCLDDAEDCGLLGDPAHTMGHIKQTYLLLSESHNLFSLSLYEIQRELMLIKQVI